ncbi:MAG: DUF4258 domain-containing protein, partial [Candidatus Fermentibacteraceae bacterium]
RSYHRQAQHLLQGQLEADSIRMAEYYPSMRASRHFSDMLVERDISMEWVNAVIEAPSRIEDRDDRTRHYIGQIKDYGNSWLRVIVNRSTEPWILVTAFFDRRLR